MRALNMQALTNYFKMIYLGVIIYGIGDEAHKGRTSDHNEDDTPGSKAAQSDADNVPEHRAIDVMLGPAINRTQMRSVIADILASPEDRDRLVYINFENSQWSASSGWVEHDNSDDPHPDHGHFSGRASADENSSPWLKSGGEMQARQGDVSEDTLILQQKMLFVRPEAATSDPKHPLVADGKYGANTAWWVSIILTGGLGDYVSPAWFDRLNDMVYNKKLATATTGPRGPEGPAGPAGPPGKTPTQVTFGPVTATVTAAE